MLQCVQLNDAICMSLRPTALPNDMYSCSSMWLMPRLLVYTPINILAPLIVHTCILLLPRCPSPILFTIYTIRWNLLRLPSFYLYMHKFVLIYKYVGKLFVITFYPCICMKLPLFLQMSILVLLLYGLPSIPHMLCLMPLDDCIWPGAAFFCCIIIFQAHKLLLVILMIAVCFLCNLVSSCLMFLSFYVSFIYASM